MISSYVCNRAFRERMFARAYEMCAAPLRALLLHEIVGSLGPVGYMYNQLSFLVTISLTLFFVASFAEFRMSSR